MPDHLHMLIGVPGDAQLSGLIRDFKRITARMAKIDWQRNFFDHRLRHDESLAEKFEYICQNPVRAGLITQAKSGHTQLTRATWIREQVRRLRTARAIEVNRLYLRLSRTFRRRENATKRTADCQ